MPHDTTLIATIAAAFVLAFGFGFAAARLRLPPLVGYLLAGVMIGPFTPGFVGDIGLAGQLAEIGVILLMFGVGLHFSIKDLLAVKHIALPGAVVQILTATVIGAAMAHAWGWSLAAGLTFGLALSVASTVVLLRALEQQRKLDSPEGRIAVGWLIVEDLAMVLALVLLPAVATTFGGSPAGLAGTASAGQGIGLAIGLTVAKVTLFVVLALVVGTRVVPWLLVQVSRTSSRELFTLAVLAIALGIALGSAQLFGVSFALGAFFAGVILSESELSQRAAEDSLPLQDAFAVLFFVSVGMLFDPAVILREPLAVIGVVLVIVIGKSVAAFVIVLAFRYPVGTALTVSASLAQIGEFSFILMGLSITLGLLPEASRDLILAGALVSIALNPFVFAGIPFVERWIKARPRLLGVLQRRGADAGDEPLAEFPKGGHAIVVGHGRVGSSITRVLELERLPYVVVERDRPRFDALRARGSPAILGDATQPELLDAAGIARARLLIIATPDSYRARRVLELAEAANPGIEMVVRTHSEDELAHLRANYNGKIVMGEQELARAMLLHVLRQFGVPPERARRLVDDPVATDLDAEAERR
ncbi:MAG: Kef family K(+) transporter [Steroidobacteraceae bacterium]|nr:Kef family K(+) transporter [Steroidobacteraceae bacterium]